MALHSPINTEGVYFITFTCHQWFPLIELADAYDAVYNWFDIMKAKGNHIFGYVIMPNHIHFILHYICSSSLNMMIGNGKRFLAYDMIKRLENKKQEKLVRVLELAVTYKDRQRNKKHEVWKTS